MRPLASCQTGQARRSSATFAQLSANFTHAVCWFVRALARRLGPPGEGTSDGDGGEIDLAGKNGDGPANNSSVAKAVLSASVRSFLLRGARSTRIGTGDTQSLNAWQARLVPSSANAREARNKPRIVSWCAQVRGKREPIGVRTQYAGSKDVHLGQGAAIIYDDCSSPQLAPA
jgi:hypothetical protein